LPTRQALKYLVHGHQFGGQRHASRVDLHMLYLKEPKIFVIQECIDLGAGFNNDKKYFSGPEYFTGKWQDQIYRDA